MVCKPTKLYDVTLLQCSIPPTWRSNCVEQNDVTITHVFHDVSRDLDVLKTILYYSWIVPNKERKEGSGLV